MHHLLAPHIQDFLESQGYFHRDQIIDLDHTTIWRQGWHSGASLGLPEVDFLEWDRYRQALRKYHIHLQDRLDEII
jgi:hypothetical protein